MNLLISNIRLTPQVEGLWETLIKEQGIIFCDKAFSYFIQCLSEIERLKGDPTKNKEHVALRKENIMDEYRTFKRLIKKVLHLTPVLDYCVRSIFYSNGDGDDEGKVGSYSYRNFSMPLFLPCQEKMVRKLLDGGEVRESIGFQESQALSSILGILMSSREFRDTKPSLGHSGISHLRRGSNSLKFLKLLSLTDDFKGLLRSWGELMIHFPRFMPELSGRKYPLTVEDVLLSTKSYGMPASKASLWPVSGHLIQMSKSCAFLT
jgi:hypothetical protein